MKNIFVLGLPLLLTGCSSLGSTPFPSARPDDFQLEYYWETGSLPPPYFYSYRIYLGAGTQGEIKFQADYSGEQTPVWVEAVNLTENDLNRLYEMLYTMGMFEKEWLQATDTPAGGSASYLKGVAYGQAFSIPSFVAGDQQARDARALYEHIEGLVPRETWVKLLALHDDYVAENEE